MWPMADTRCSASVAVGAGCSETNPDDEESIAANVVSLSPAAVRTIDRTGGTMLHTSRTNPGRVNPGNVPAFLADQAVGDGPFDFTAHTIRVIEGSGSTRSSRLAATTPCRTASDFTTRASR